MNQLIPLINRLQDAVGTVGPQFVDLPQIVVEGSQSSGKSSVLESFVGRDFLPRGSGIVTRRPLVLQLYNTQKGRNGEAPEEYGEFLHLPGRRFADFSEIRKEIVRETERLTGTNKGISNQSINLRIYSPHVLNLTLVDLPGITKVPTGDQPDDVEDQIRQMCYDFISNPNAIILAVSAANQDLVNSDALQMARSVDPDGERTIGVLTKVDIMDHGTDCSEILANKVIPLKKGYIAVVNRSQRDIDQNVSIRNGLMRETEFFQNHPKYRNMLNHCGTTNLAVILNKMLIHHIKNCLPDLRSKISATLAQNNRLLSELGETMNESGYKQLFLRIISDFANGVAQSSEGRLVVDFVPSELYGGARIAYIFNEIFSKTLMKASGIEGLDDNAIRIAIANSYGSRQFLFIPEKSFYELVRSQIERLLEPGLQCAEQVFEEMGKLAESAVTVELMRFPVLRDRVMEVVKSLLADCLEPTRGMISNIIAVEKSYINISHPDFIGGKEAVASAQARVLKMLQSQSSDGHHPTSSTTNSSTNINSTSASSSTPPTVVSSVSSATSNTIAMDPDDMLRESTTNLPPSISPSPSSLSGKGFGSQMEIFRGKGSSSGAVSANANSNSSTALTMPRTPLAQPPRLPANITTRDPRSGIVSNTPFSTQISESDLKLPLVPEHIHRLSRSSEKERVETEIIRIMIESYFDVVKKTFVDMVPKIVSHFLIDAFKKDLHNRLVSQLYSENLANDLMKESDSIAEKRKECEKMKDVLSRALQIVNEVRDFSMEK